MIRFFCKSRFRRLQLSNPQFQKFIELMAQLNTSGKIPAKECRACGKTYCDLHQYIWETEAKAQSMEDAGGVMGKPFTMMYRNCSCGNTLVLTLTDQNFPELDKFWDMIRQESEFAQLPLRETVLRFMLEWEDYIDKHQNSSKKIRLKR